MRICIASFVCGSIVLAAGCSGDAGSQSETPPQAAITVIGYATTQTSSGTIDVTVRSQAEIALSGKDSYAASKPILTFAWAPTNLAAQGVQLIKRNNSTQTFFAPKVTANTLLTFRLTVADGDGRTSSANINVHVVPALDSNRFLANEVTVSDAGADQLFSVVVTPAAAIAAGASAPDVPFELTLRKKVAYRKRSDAPAPAPRTGLVDLGTITTIQGKWVGSVGSPGANPAAVQNPRYSFLIPDLNADEINVLSQDAAPGDAARDAQLNLSDIDDAEVLVDISVRPLNTARKIGFYVLSSYAYQGDLNVVLDRTNTPMHIENDGSLAAATLTVSTEDIGAYQSTDHRALAQQYYDSVDPNHRRTTLNDWLSVNCFDTSKPFYDASGTKGAHAVYVNNFDLGFGRDMYMRTASCGPGTVAKPHEFNDGDMATVVINYPTLDAAIKKTGPVIAVAMEYRAIVPSMDCSTGKPCVRSTAFYVFAPDEKTGEFRRIASANFDGRGEKLVPGSCTACHGSGVQLSDPVTGDPRPMMGSMFLPFDLQSLRYSDTDPSFTKDPDDAPLITQFTQAKQEAEFTKFNQAVLNTYDDVAYNFNPDGTPDLSGGLARDFTSLRTLINGWYQSGSFDGSYVPTGWQDGQSYTVDWDMNGDGTTPDTYTNPAGTATLYKKSIAQYCRACHLQLNSDIHDFASYGSYIGNEIDHYLDPMTQTTKLRGAIRMHVFERGDMPGARLTMDRFWVPASDGSIPGELLANDLAAAVAAVTPSFPITTPTAPGVPVLRPSRRYRPPFEIWTQQNNSGQIFEFTVDQPDFEDDTLRTASPGPIRLDARFAKLAQTFTWNVCFSSGTTIPANPTCTTPNVKLIGDSTTTPAFNAVAGVYVISLTAQDEFNRATNAVTVLRIQ